MKTYQYYKLQDQVIGIKITDSNSSSFICVPINDENSDYAEIMRQVEAGELVIQEADAPE